MPNWSVLFEAFVAEWVFVHVKEHIDTWWLQHNCPMSNREQPPLETENKSFPAPVVCQNSMWATKTECRHLQLVSEAACRGAHTVLSRQYWAAAEAVWIAVSMHSCLRKRSSANEDNQWCVRSGDVWFLVLVIISVSGCSLEVSQHVGLHPDTLARCWFSLPGECSEIGHQGNYSVAGTPP